MKLNDRNKIIAIIATLLLHVAIIVVLLFSFLDYEWPPKDMPLPQESEILFGGEYVMLGNVPTPASDDMNNAQAETAKDAAVADAPDTKNAGTAGETPELISTDNDSPMKVKKKEEKPKKTGPTKEELAEQERVKREKAESQKIKNRVSFSNAGKGSGKEGSPNGNASVGARSGAPGHSLKGRTLENWGRPSSQVEGVVIIEVRVNAKGKVIAANYQGGKGSAAANASVRKSCVQASLNSRFSVSTESTAEQVGTITWRFE
ncbi:MAG: hypothetical protein PHR45_07270 [Muribaculaceae bacterium]|nr:hypothetical protein [Muribaculaceae bacterium]